ncbi:MAG: DUF1189 domain-containing protein [Phycisphaerae bacterium]
MKKFNILHVPLLSFYSRELYRDVGWNWRGVCFGYLLLLLVICSALSMFAVHRALSNFVDKEVPPLIDQVPRITITDGQVSIDEPQPYYIKAPDSNDVLVVVDTTGTIQSLDDTKAIVLLTKTKVTWRQGKMETRTFDLTQVKHFVLDKDRIMGWLDIIKKYLVLALYPFAVLASYIFRIIQALIYGAIGLLFATWCRVKLSYAALLRLAVVAVTPCIIVRTILELASLYLPWWAYLWFFLAAMGFLFFGVKACSQPEGPTTFADEIVSENQNQTHNY